MFAALAVAALCAPGTWLRTEVPREVPRDIVMARIAGAAQTPLPDWRVEGVWQYSTGPSRKFGGYSALFTLGDKNLRAFSDRGYRFTFPTPDTPDQDPAARVISLQALAEEPLNWLLWDIESATRDPATGDYWLGYEYTHAIHRFTIASVPDGVRMLGEEVEWSKNSGLEAMLRLSDGRFIAIPEGRSYAMIWAGDPIEGGKARRIPFENPAESYAVTDMAQLPDGRVLLLMRNLVWGLPPFAGLLAIADPPQPGSTEAWVPRVVLRFDGVLPPENYEGLAVREQDDGTIAVWIISDDNVSVFQRTLVAKLVFDPGKQSD
ncbi:esterase-like activity of phytase family protein [Erythrobacter aurantius]|uniref:esterase-like activity of phytase family protein n=1 Tax=Erythrobacter aurantius TaxID=2909249 RepID=UPI002079DD07|nr:esterase-like activity of phytase family protein [Erythrobacter aurantius]